MFQCTLTFPIVLPGFLGLEECMFPLTRLLLGPGDAIGSLLGSLGEDEKQCVSVFSQGPSQ